MITELFKMMAGIYSDTLGDTGECACAERLCSWFPGLVQHPHSKGHASIDIKYRATVPTMIGIQNWNVMSRRRSSATTSILAALPIGVSVILGTGIQPTRQ
jgi:hypothetical protein